MLGLGLRAGKKAATSAAIVANAFDLELTSAPGAFPLAARLWPDELTAIGDLLVVERSASLDMSSPTTLANFSVTQSHFDNGFGTALNLPSSGTGFLRVTIGNRRSTVWQYGNAAAPTITSSATINVAELQQLAFALTASGTPVREWRVWADADMLNYEVSGSTLRYYDNGVGDYEAGATQNLVTSALGYNGVRVTQALTVNQSDVDELPDAPVFAPVFNRTPGSAAVTFTWTVANMAAGVFCPFTVTGAQAVRKNGVAVAGGAGNLSLGDVIAIEVLPHASNYLTANTAAVSFGGTTQGGTGSANAIVVTGTDPAKAGFDFVTQSGGNSPFVERLAAGTLSTTLSVNLAAGLNRLIIISKNRQIASASLNTSGAVTIQATSWGTVFYAGLVEGEVTVASEGVQTLTVTAASGTLSDVAVLVLQPTNAATSLVSTATKNGNYNGTTPSTTAALTVPTNGIGFACAVLAINSSIGWANGVRILDSALFSGTLRFGLAAYTATATPQASVANDVSAIVAFSYDKAP